MYGIAAQLGEKGAPLHISREKVDQATPGEGARVPRPQNSTPALGSWFPISQYTRAGLRHNLSKPCSATWC